MAKCTPDIRALAIDQLIKADGGADAIKKLARSVLDSDGQLGLNIMARETMKPNWKKALFQMRSAGLLSRPTTHARNILGNFGTSIGAVPERYLAAGISKLKGDNAIEFGEANALAMGWLEGQREAILMLSKSKNARTDPTMQSAFELARPGDIEHVNHLVPEAFGVDSSGSTFGKGLAFAMKAANLPHDFLQFQDDFFKTVAYRQELNASAYRKAKAEGLEGQSFIDRVNDLKSNPPEELQLKSYDFALYQTFTNELGEKGRKFGQLINGDDKIGYLLKTVIPYYKTPVNIFKYTFERTPLALISENIRADIRAGGSRAATAQARIALGSSLMAIGASMATNGTITGSGSQNSNQKKIQRQTGWQPYSVKVGDKWVSYNGLEPYSTYLGLSADIANLTLGLNEEDSEALAVAGTMAIVQNLASKTYTSGVFDFVAAIDEGNFKATPEGWIIGQAQTFIPFSSAMRGAARAKDPILRDTKTEKEGIDGFMEKFVNEFKAKVPGMSDILPARLDLFGEEINVSSDQGMLYDFASPLTISEENPNAIESAILDNKVSVSWPQRSVNGVKLSAQQYHDYSKRAGTLTKELLGDVVKTTGFKRLSIGEDGMQAQIIKRMINQARDVAKAELIANDNTLRNKIFEKKKEAVQKLTGQ